MQRCTTVDQVYVIRVRVFQTHRDYREEIQRGNTEREYREEIWRGKRLSKSKITNKK